MGWMASALPTRKPPTSTACATCRLISFGSASNRTSRAPASSAPRCNSSRFLYVKCLILSAVSGEQRNRRRSHHRHRKNRYQRVPVIAKMLPQQRNEIREPHLPDGVGGKN